MSSFSNSIQRFANSPELVGLTMTYLKSWRDLVNISAVNALYRREAKTHIQILIRRLLQTFMHDKEHAAFWRIMEQTLSIITGELPMALLLLDCIMGSTLDIITPLGVAAQVVSFLVNDCGYHEYSNPPPAIAFGATNSVSRVYYCSKATEKVGQNLTNTLTSH